MSAFDMLENTVGKRENNSYIFSHFLNVFKALFLKVAYTLGLCGKGLTLSQTDKI